jgi:hypothetical protein
MGVILERIKYCVPGILKMYLVRIKNPRVKTLHGNAEKVASISWSSGYGRFGFQAKNLHKVTTTNPRGDDEHGAPVLLRFRYELEQSIPEIFGKGRGAAFGRPRSLTDIPRSAFGTGRRPLVRGLAP